MPLYEYECAKGHRFERVLPLERYDEPQMCECGWSATKLVSAPMVAPDLPAYTSPIDGRLVHGRKQRREDLLRNNCVEYEPSMKGEYLRRKAKEEADFEKSIGETVEAQIHAMPARKRELLEQELRAGASTEYARFTPTN